MFSAKLRIFVFVLVVAFACHQAQADTDAVARRTRKLAVKEPIWFQRIAAGYVGDSPLEKCHKRPGQPTSGSACSIAPKTCFFGTQTCSDVGPHPTSKCSCAKKVWTCTAETCPALLAPTAAPTMLPTLSSKVLDAPSVFPTLAPTKNPSGCTPAGTFDLSGNDPSCPSVMPEPNSPCTDAQSFLNCAFGTEACCGRCFADMYATCFDGTWMVRNSDACMRPTC